jgi:tRNA threonylcarbamoyl adenosine modification protein (Sua5/YciO/YrdC/YwlC family)
VSRWTDTSPATLDEIAAVLRGGGVVLLPTDTIYGLHGLAGNREVTSRIAAIKGREETKPFVVLAASVTQVEALGAAVPPILNDLWPAPLTAVLATNQAFSIAVRVPAVEWLRSLLERTGPLISTSANRAGEPPISTPDRLAQTLHDALDGLLDAGPIAGEPSAIVDFTGDEPRLIREGEPGFTQNLRKTLRISL